MKHSPAFLKIVNEAREHVSELTVQDVKRKMDAGETFHLVDVREDREWQEGHLPGAIHVGKGVIERDIENTIQDTAAPIILYCGGGYRSALAARALGQMGYVQVWSMDGGFREWREREYPLQQD